MQVLNHEQLKSLLKEKGIFYKDSPSGWIGITCPTCSVNDSKKMRRYIKYNVPTSHCFICQQKLFLHDILGKDIIIPTFVENEIVKPKEHAQARVLPVLDNYVTPINELDKNHPAIKFLQKDHFYDFDFIWENFLVSYIPKNGAIPLTFGKYKINPEESLLFPVLFKGVLIGWQLRFVPGTTNGDYMISKKYKYMHVYPKGNYLYNFDNVQESPFVVVVEGIKKAWKYPSAAIATLGKDITEIQLREIAKMQKKVMFLLDNDKTIQGSNGKIENDYILNLGIKKITAINVNPGDYGFKSPDEMTFEEVENVIQKNKHRLDL